MRVLSLVSATITTALAGLAFVGLSVSALSALPSSDQRFLLSPDNPAFFEEYLSDHFRFSPHFAIVQPVGTRPVYKKDSHDRITDIEFLTASDEIVRQVTLRRPFGLEEPDTLTVRTFAQNSGVAADNFELAFEYAGYRERRRVAAYMMRTSRGHAFATPMRSAAGSYDLSVVPMGAHANFVLANAQPWDGKSIRIVPASSTGNV
ncbi:hypothetical protein THASP1DRAFT_22523 [Thamnocephalis sphaerospora]|uniref:Uncharacterized protein n=1 Tax=Thamnocephalis sphaerospora TaxID=78915 RepID=A0A4P9XW70_9FUNG|nr:hypothetical protein THASP1DRAFT_22523 [Thamnocephalis sphaerospora]|eukprot:RKP09660.1 hypothetical protein THASP1DRAFT_22523 [Thamnocephalis sphaerospora]